MGLKNPTATAATILRKVRHCKEASGKQHTRR
jgi:hypothetical protein